MMEQNQDIASVEIQAITTESIEKVYAFCFYFLPNKSEIQETLIEVFKEFGHLYRKQAFQKTGDKARDEKIALFQVAWDLLSVRTQVKQTAWLSGRDLRKQKLWDEDLLASNKDWREMDSDAQNVFLERLFKIEVEHRAPLVLKDILGFDDEEAVLILKLRWGIYRHRLHRGRIELVDSLHGTNA